MEFLLAQVAGREVVQLPEEQTPIQQFYHGKNIFVTGGTGTIGKLTIARLLQCCPQLEQIVLLVRSKSANQVGQRIEELFNHAVFDDVRYHNPELLRKIQLVRGDLSLPNLGLTAEDITKLVNATDIVLHMGSTTLFDGNFKNSAHVNVRATRDLLNIAKRMKRLKVFLHASSLFVNSHKNVLEEEIERPYISAKALIEFVESMDPNLRYDKPINLGRCPNNCIFTKSIAEELVKNEGRNLPVVIARLPMLISSQQYPSRGYTDNVNSLVGLTMTSYLGLNKSILAKKDKIAEVLPADMAANAVIAIAWDTAQTKGLNDNVEVPNEERLLVYNLTSSKSNQLTWNLFFHLATKYGYRYPTIYTLSFPWHLVHEKKNWHFYLITVFHYIPGYMIDFITLYLFYQTKYIGYYSKIDMLSRSLTYFMMHSWDVKVENSRHLLRKMDDGDKELFDFDATSIDWETYFDYYIRGIRKYVLKDSDGSLPMAKKQNAKRFLILIAKLFVLALIILYYLLRIV